MARVVLSKVSLTYPVYGLASRSLKRTLLHLGSAGKIATNTRDIVEVAALRDVSFDAVEGDRIAFIGANGAGKSTLLRVLAQIYPPTSGTISIDGFAVPLLDVSLGIQDDSTGYENIYLRSLLLGLRPKEIDQRIQEIADFTELGDYINLPVRTYSSGMRMRLAFAVSTCIQPEILIMDEWISTGDARFVSKAETKLKDLVGSTKILFLASHSLSLVEQVCNKALVLHQGASQFFGPVSEALACYRELCA